jgi:hypothetical protein
LAALTRSQHPRMNAISPSAHAGQPRLAAPAIHLPERRFFRWILGPSPRMMGGGSHGESTPFAGMRMAAAPALPCGNLACPPRVLCLRKAGAHVSGPCASRKCYLRVRGFDGFLA